MGSDLQNAINDSIIENSDKLSVNFNRTIARLAVFSNCPCIDVNRVRNSRSKAKGMPKAQLWLI